MPPKKRFRLTQCRKGGKLSEEQKSTAKEARTAKAQEKIAAKHAKSCVGNIGPDAEVSVLSTDPQLPTTQFVDPSLPSTSTLTYEAKVVEKKRKDAARYFIRKETEAECERQKRLATMVEQARLRRLAESVAEGQVRLAQQADYKRKRWEGESETTRAARLAEKAGQERQRYDGESETTRAARLAEKAGIESQRYDGEIEVQRVQRLAEKADQVRQTRESETDSQRLERLAQNADAKAQRRESETESQRTTRLADLQERAQLSRLANAMERQEAAESEATLRADEAGLDLSQHIAEDESTLAVNEPIVPDLAPVNLVRTHLCAATMDVENVPVHSCGNQDQVCAVCLATHYKGELPTDKQYKSCCHKGKVILEPLFPYPDVMWQLLTGVDENSKHFRKHIRAYNSSLSFASVGAQIEAPIGWGTYCFRVHGNIQHTIANVGGGVRPLYSHLYFIDADEARSIRESRLGNEELKPNLLFLLDAEIRRVNPFAYGLKMLGQVEAEERARAEAEGRPVVRAELHILDQRRRRYELPTSHDVAVVYESDNTGRAPASRDIRIHTHDGRFQQLSVLSPNKDPLSYVLLFPLGDPGWQTGMPHTRATANSTVTHLEFYSSRLHERQGSFNPLLHAGKLTQQYIVDAYVTLEGNRLEFIRKNQSKLRAELYSGLVDHLNNRAERQGYVVGKMVILPSSFIGSPRHMQQLYQDAMAIVTKFGKPDIFLTVTCNPKWPEIQNSLEPYEHAADRPDLTARVFQIKLKELMVDITKRNVLGVPIASFYTIEFQKRGLPHAHILLIMREEDKLRSAEQIDALICAELPDPETQPRLHKIVVSTMLHGPCGARNPKAVCMEDGKCKKKFPKAFQEETTVNDRGFTVYRRRDNGRTHTLPGNRVVDSRDVVPYNPYLSVKYDCHMNLEHCGSTASVKYVCNYVYKGPDCATVKVTISAPAVADAGQQSDAAGRQQMVWDEVSTYHDTRYVSAPEAMWRMLEFDMHDKSHSIIRLAVHLEGNHVVVFQAGEEQAAADRGQVTLSNLTAWFKLNETSPEARQYKYMEIPYHYVFTRGRVWTPRKRGEHRIISRLYSVSPRDIERYHLRLLLLHVTGATCYEDVRTYQGVVYPTFKEAAKARNLLLDDDEWVRCLQEAVAIKMPHQLRQLFAVICVFCEPTNPLSLWERFKGDFCEDFARESDPIEAEQMALNAIQAILALHRMTNASIGLPEPRVPVFVPVEEQFDQTAERVEAETNVARLNVRQRAAFDAIMAAVDDPQKEQRCFYLDGPGGSGKTFLYNTLISALRAQGNRTAAVAWTGIAATLLKGGRTCHSRFRLPVPLVETSTSGVKPNTNEGGVMRACKLIIWDEVTMAPSLALMAVERMLRDVTGDTRPFGGKVMLIGGDFRQCLPVVKNGNRTTIVEQSIKRCTLWPLFETMELRANMRANQGENEFVAWLLRVGNGELLNDHHLSEDTIALPDQCVVPNIVDAVFGKTIGAVEMADMLDHAILCPKNVESLAINEAVLDRLQGEVRVYHSADSVECGEGEDEDALTSDFQTEYLNSLTPGGMPPHKLRLKVNAVVMLLRNINVRAGLCNGTRLSVVALRDNVIDCRIIGGTFANDRVFLARLNLAPTDVGLPFILKRRQFPIRLSFAMTINKAQGQSLKRVGIYLEKPVFGHGQLYVALSRARSIDSVFVTVAGNEAQGKLIKSCDITFTRNVVYKEVLGSALEINWSQDSYSARPGTDVQLLPQAVQSMDNLAISDNGDCDECPMVISDDDDEPTAMTMNASLHQGDSRFVNAGVQCTAMAACSIAMAKALCPTRWQPHTLDSILEAGDTLYSLSSSNLREGEVYLSVEELHDHFTVAGMNTWISTSSSENIADDSVHGLLRPVNFPTNGNNDLTAPDLLAGLNKFFQKSSNGILTAASIAVAVGVTDNGTYWLFDSHSRNDRGFLVPDGAACLTMSRDLQVLCDMFRANAITDATVEAQQYTMEAIVVVEQMPDFS